MQILHDIEESDQANDISEQTPVSCIFIAIFPYGPVDIFYTSKNNEGAGGNA